MRKKGERPHQIEFSCGDLTLEGMLSLPEGGGPFPLVVVCHPHPLYGGNMFNNVVQALCEALGTDGMGWVKFNFRGVGRSGGKFAGGLGEREDARAAISFGEKQERIAPERIGICGYSFGSLVAFGVAAEDPRVKAVAGISPFIQPANLLDKYLRPKLFVTGSRDEFVDGPSLEKQVRRMPDPKEFVLFPGADHFWAGDEAPVAEKVVHFFQQSI